MSWSSWSRQYYKTHPGRYTPGRVRAMFDHAIAKWTGLLKKNMKAHGVRRVVIERDGKPTNWLVDASSPGTPMLWVGTTSCSLCTTYLHQQEYAGHPCFGCPLFHYLDDRPCSAPGMPFAVWVETGDARPMLRALRRLAKGAS